MSAALYRSRKTPSQRAWQGAKTPVGSRGAVKILMVTSEATPFAKTGGLGDVLGALPPALARLGEDVAVVLPLYRGVTLDGAERVWSRLPLWVGQHNQIADIDLVMHHGVRYFF